MTRNWPMTNTPGDEHDHPHHRSLWFGHGVVNEVDFGRKRTAAEDVHDGFSKSNPAAIRASFSRGTNGSRRVARWLHGRATFRVFSKPANERVFDFEITITAGDKDAVFGDTKEGTMACGSPKRCE